MIFNNLIYQHKKTFQMATKFNEIIVSIIDNPNDDSKQIILDNDSATTSTYTTLKFSQTVNRVISFPDTTGTLIAQGQISNIGTGAKIYNDTTPNPTTLEFKTLTSTSGTVVFTDNQSSINFEVQGFVGVQGFQGEIGVQGNQGNQGFVGVQGNQGNQGFVGVQGNQGEIGVQGNQGNQGFVGDGVGTNFAYAYSTASQTVAVANVFQLVTFTNNTSNGWIVAGNVFTCPATATYRLTYNGRIVSSAGAPNNISMTINIGSTPGETEIAGGQTNVNIDTNNVGGNITGEVLTTITAATTITLQFTGSATTVGLTPGGSTATAGTTIGVTFTIVRV